MHSEDAVVLALIAALTACTPKAPSPSAALEGSGARGGRDAGRRTNVEDDEDEDEREDLAVLDAGISLRALSCTTDRECLTHRCDVEHERCRFPCRDDRDCHPGARCAVDAGDLAACFVNR